MRSRVDDVYGNASRPAREDDVMAKFRANARRAVTADGAAQLEKTILMTVEHERLPLARWRQRCGCLRRSDPGA